MKKNLTKRTGIILLALVMLTSCFVGGTFAKYITSQNLGGNSAYDGTNGDGSAARVAKWGVTIGSELGTDGAAAGSKLALFAKQYATHDSTYNGAYSVVSTDYVVAPGTGNVTTDDEGNKTGGAIKIKLAGTPEVAAKIEAQATVAMVNEGKWTVTVGETTKFYCPLIFYIGNKVVDGKNYTSLDALNAALADAGKWSTVVAPGTDLATLVDGTNAEGNGEIDLTIGWEWPFETGNDAWDTALGNAAAAAAEVEGGAAAGLGIVVKGTVTVTQVD